MGRQIFCFHLFTKYLLGSYSTPNTELTDWLGGEEGRSKWNDATLALSRTPRAAFIVQVGGVCQVHAGPGNAEMSSTVSTLTKLLAV